MTLFKYDTELRDDAGTAHTRQRFWIFGNLIFAGLVALLSMGTSVFAETPNVDALRAALMEKLPGTEISSLTETPIPGLYEMVTGKNIFYVDQSGRYSIIGTLYDIASHEDMTAKRLTELGFAPDPGKEAVEGASQSIPWDQLPKGAAIVENKGAKYKLAVFTDINCPYCRRLADILKDMPDVEVHTYLITLWKRSIEPTKAILCATDKVAALHAAYQNDFQTPSETCAPETLNSVTAFASRHGISGTPFLIRSDGATSAGLRSKAFLLDWLKEAKL